MKKRVLAAAMASALLALPSAQAAELESLEQKTSYIMGLNVAAQAAKQLQSLGYELNQEAFLQGLKEASLDHARSLSEETIQLTMQEAQTRFQELQQAATAEQEAERAKQGASNQSAGDSFLAANAKKEGIEVTESGLQYKIISAGDGTMPTAADTVQVHYRGTLIDGTEFDSSYKHGDGGPATFPLNSVIPGWTEGLQLISKGGKAELYIPAALAYGPNGMGQLIGPNSALVFEVELLDINPAK
ncbi:MAG: FKBP-type peptidyl-prolyl cis-trans isomerase [Motiliproteus sp.]|jgi:FKBP-type peptidyl-prolyl cis-trans isomerase